MDNGKRNLIGFAGKARSGKGELAKALQEKYPETIILSFAKYMKQMTCEILDITWEQLDKLKNNNSKLIFTPNDSWVDIMSNKTKIDKELISKELDNMKNVTTIRQLLQFVGTDIIRKYNPTWHVDNLVNEVLTYPSDRLIAIDDIRFVNEKDAVEKLGGTVYYIVREMPNGNNVPNHASENSLSIEDFDSNKVLYNNGTLEEHKRKFLEIYENNIKN